MKCQRGFTLVEVVVALTVLSLLSLATLTALRNFAGTQTRLTDVSERSGELRQVVGFLRQNIEIAQAEIDNSNNNGFIYFESDGQSLTWIAPLAVSRHLGGVMAFRLTLEDETLLLRLQRFPAEEGSLNWENIQPHVLLNQINRIEFAFSTAFGEPYESEWPQQALLPDRVKISIARAGRYWPDIVINMQNSGALSFVR